MWPFRTRRKPNTINLYGDLDDVELLQDVERTFDIRIADETAEQLRTMGDLEAEVRVKMSDDADLLWVLLCRIAKDHAGHKGPIDRETTFFAIHANERSRHG